MVELDQCVVVEYEVGFFVCFVQGGVVIVFVWVGGVFGDVLVVCFGGVGEEYIVIFVEQDEVVGQGDWYVILFWRVV